MAMATSAAKGAIVQGSPLHARYAEAVNRESAHEILTAKLEAGAAQAEAEQAAQAAAKEQTALQAEADRLAKESRGRRTSKNQETGNVEKVLEKHEIGRAACRERGCQ